MPELRSINFGSHSHPLDHLPANKMCNGDTGVGRAMLPSEFYRGRNKGRLSFAVWTSSEGLSVDICGFVLKALTQDHSDSFGQSREVMMLHCQVISTCCFETRVWTCGGHASF